MPQTVDAHHGELIEETGLKVSSTAAPTQEGELRYYDGSWLGYDSSGSFNLRSGSGGITEEQHRVLDQLVHDLAETCWKDVQRVDSEVTAIIVWNQEAEPHVKIRETQITRVDGDVTQVVTIQYDAAGVEKERMTSVFTYVSGDVDEIDETRTTP